jgi:hypothetical protein
MNKAKDYHATRVFHWKTASHPLVWQMGQRGLLRESMLINPSRVGYYVPLQNTICNFAMWLAVMSSNGHFS